MEPSAPRGESASACWTGVAWESPGQAERCHGSSVLASQRPLLRLAMPRSVSCSTIVALGFPASSHAPINSRAIRFVPVARGVHCETAWFPQRSPITERTGEKNGSPLCAGPREWVQIPFLESVEVSHKPCANDGTDRLCGERASLPNVRDCYDSANLCIDVWSSGDHVNCSWVLRTAEAWLQLAFLRH
jgi:hypothetical protein